MCLGAKCSSASAEGQYTHFLIYNIRVYKMSRQIEAIMNQVFLNEYWVDMYQDKKFVIHKAVYQILSR